MRKHREFFGFGSVAPVRLYIPFVAEGRRSRVGAGDQSQHGENGNAGRCTIAEERQSQTDNGHNADAHADVDHNLEHQCGACAEADQTTHIILAADTHIEAPGNDGQFQNHNENTAEETQFFADG